MLVLAVVQGAFDGARDWAASVLRRGGEEPPPWRVHSLAALDTLVFLGLFVTPIVACIAASDIWPALGSAYPWVGGFVVSLGGRVALWFVFPEVPGKVPPDS